MPRYVAPGSLDEALRILDEASSARPIAGGTDLLVELDRGGHSGLDVLVDLGRISGLNTITDADDGIHLGPLVTHNQVVASKACVELALPLAQACLEVGSPQLRNRATIAGNIITASPANDTISALIAMRASVEVSSASGSRRQLVADFITGFRETSLTRGELVTDVIVPHLKPDERGVFVKLGLRRAQAISVVHLAVVVALADDVVTDVRMALGSVAPTVVLVPDIASVLFGRALDDETVASGAAMAALASHPIDDLRATATYRSEVVEVMAKRALAALGSGTHATGWPANQPLLWGNRFDGRFPTGKGFATDVVNEDEISSTINGSKVAASGASGITLLDFLRDRAGLRGVKEGCAEGECGACTVYLDGAAVMSCLVPAACASGAEITTIEGLADGETLHPMQRAFVESGAVQCGFCTPGLVMACAKLIEENASPSLSQVQAALAGNLCRCTGYRSIEMAVASVAVGGDS